MKFGLCSPSSGGVLLVPLVSVSVVLHATDSMGDSPQAERKALPERTTRGKRLRAQIANEEEQADAEFWSQEFFAEDAGDADYVSEKEEEDVPDSDFFKSESEVDEDEEVEVRREPKKKTLKPPGAPPSRPKAAKPPAPKPLKAASASPSQPASQAAAAGELPQQVLFEAIYEAPSLRKSTRARTEAAQQEREQREQLAKSVRKPPKQGEYRVLTQEELLAEAARTELENLASLKQLLAQEEETKRKANIRKQRFGGPLMKFRSRAIEVLGTAEQIKQQQEEVAAAAAVTAAGAQGAQPSFSMPLGWGPPMSHDSKARDKVAAAAASARQQQSSQPSVPAAAARDTRAAPATASGTASGQVQPVAPAPAAAAPAAADGPCVCNNLVDPNSSSAGTTAAAIAGSAATPMEIDFKTPAAAARPTTADVKPPVGDAAALAVKTEGSRTEMALNGAQTTAEPSAATAAVTTADGKEQQAVLTTVRQLLTTLQACGMKAPKWLQPQRAMPPPPKPVCAITGAVAKYRDPITGHYYATLDAFRELRRRLGQPLPAAPKSRTSAAATAAGLSAQGSLDSTWLPGQIAGEDSIPDCMQSSKAGFPSGQLQLQELILQQMQQQRLLTAQKASKKSSSMYYQQQTPVPDEVAALVLNVSQLVHGAAM